MEDKRLVESSCPDPIEDCRQFQICGSLDVYGKKCPYMGCKCCCASLGVYPNTEIIAGLLAQGKECSHKGESKKDASYNWRAHFLFLSTFASHKSLTNSKPFSNRTVRAVKTQSKSVITRIRRFHQVFYQHSLFVQSNPRDMLEYTWRDIQPPFSDY